jgi:hypothetical protein
MGRSKAVDEILKVFSDKFADRQKTPVGKFCKKIIGLGFPSI